MVLFINGYHYLQKKMYIDITILVIYCISTR